MRLLTRVGIGRRLKYLDGEGSELLIFTAFRDELYSYSGLSVNTINLYLGHVARFIEFVHALAHIARKYGQLAKYVMPVYEEYLTGTSDNKPGLALLARRLTGRNANASSHSLLTIDAALTRFLWFNGLSVSRSLDLSMYLDGCTRTTAISPREIQEFRKKAEAYGLYSSEVKEIKKSRKFKTTTRLFRGTANIPENHDELSWRPNKAIPTETINKLYENFTTYRDKALAAVQLAYGIRTSEAVALTDPDIDLLKREVRIQSNLLHKRGGLSQKQFDKLSNKGRATPETMGHEPWVTDFFNFYEKYLKYERIPNVGHNFCFQILHGKTKGQPLFTSNRSSLNRTFHRAARKAAISLHPGVAAHSLRHHYGVFTRHDAPTLKGHGFPEKVTQTYMGHKHPSTTKKYTNKNHREFIDVANEITNSKRPENLDCDD